jgi:hypothetical protein
MTHGMGLVRKPVQSTWQKSPIGFPTRVIVDPRDEDWRGCLGCVLRCFVVEARLGFVRR